VSQEQQTAACRAEFVRQGAKLGFEHARNLATLNTASIVLIAGFLRNIFPNTPEGGLYVSVGTAVLISVSFVLFGLSLLLSGFAMYTFFRAADGENPHYVKALYQTRVGIPFVCFFLGLVWFGIATLINVL